MSAKETVSQLAHRGLKAHGIQVISFAENDFGLLNVPGKWCAVISDLTNAFDLRERGEPVVLNPVPAKKRRRT